jgi:predicted Zn-dependent peptidase
MSIHRETLANGIRIIHIETRRPVSHCGIFIPAGTRDETREEHGIAHFIEHTLFKGTEKRTMLGVLNRLENVGADLNAFTTKEETCIHASFLARYYERALELIHDICFHSVFPEKEIEKEKEVVIDEILSYQDTPADQIFDDFEDLLFKGHPLGRNILGTVPGIRKITRDKISGFIKKNYRDPGIVISSVGDIAFPDLVSLAEKYFGNEPLRSKRAAKKPVLAGTPGEKIVYKPINQVHCIAGTTACPFTDHRKIPTTLLNNLLGGPLMNSRLSLALREKNGMTYHVESNYLPYSDQGVFSVYFGTAPAHYEKALSIIHRELGRLRDTALSRTQLDTVKKQLKGQLAIAYESNISVMLTMGKSIRMQDRYDPIETVIADIDQTGADELQEIARDIFDPGRWSILTFYPRK